MRLEKLVNGVSVGHFATAVDALNATETSQQRTLNNGFIRFVPWLCVMAIAMSVWARVRLSEMPLERDEGEYAYAGQLILRGTPPYTDAYNMKLPGTYVAYAVIMGVLGETPTAIRLGLVVVNLITCLLIFLAGRKLFDIKRAWTGAAAYAVLSVSPVFQGLWAHATHFVSLLVAAGFLALIHARRSGRRALWFLCGFAFGAAFVMKQHGLFFMAIGPVVLLAEALANHGTTKGRAYMLPLMANIIGAVLPFGLVVGWVGTVGSFESFWFWTFRYARQYAAQVGFVEGLRTLAGTVGIMLPATLLLLALAGVGVWRGIYGRDGTESKRLLAILLFASVLSILPGLYFRAHYFITMLPALALLIASGSGCLLGATIGRFAMLALCLSQPLMMNARGLYACSGRELTQITYPGNPFVESVEVARYIREHTGEQDTVAVIGSEPQIYFLSGRRSATGHIYMYGLMELHPYALAMQKEMAAEVEESRPKFIVLAETDLSWLRRETSETWVFGWLPRYLSEHYRMVGMGEYDAQGKHVVVKWAEDDQDLDASRPHILLVFQRKSPGD